MIFETKNRTPIPRSSLAQWLSGAASLGTVLIASWALFFSSASQSLVSYLQSELTVRNNKIVLAEIVEARLNTKIEERAATLALLQSQTSMASDKLKELSEQNETQAAKLQIAIEQKTQTEEQLSELTLQINNAKVERVKLILLVEVKSKIISVDALEFARGSYSEQDFQHRTVDAHVDYVKYLEDFANTLSEADRSMARKLVEKFDTACRKKTKPISIKNIRLKKTAENLYDTTGSDEREVYETAIQKELDLLLNQQQTVVKCFESMT